MKLPVPSPGAIGATLLVLCAAAVVTTGTLVGLEIALLVAAGSALVAVIALLFGSIQSLTGESPLSFEEALTLGAPSAEEEQKRAVLRALKDLEYERSVGKISDQDYAELSARYRAEAKRLIELLDDNLSPARERAEKALAERLGTSAAPPGERPAPAEPPPDSEAKAAAASTPPRSSAEDEPA